MCYTVCTSNRFSQRRASTAQQQQQQPAAEGSTARPETFLEARSRFKSSNMQEGKNPIYRTDSNPSTSTSSSTSAGTAAATTSAANAAGATETVVQGSASACGCTCGQQQLDKPLDKPLDKQQQSLGGRPTLSVVTAAAASYNVSGSRSSLVSTATCYEYCHYSLHRILSVQASDRAGCLYGQLSVYF
jgi:polygalacturonase